MKQQQQQASTYPSDFNAVVLSLASPEKIKEWSFGEVTKPETINYRTQRSERGGLFDEKIFGPEKDYECYCGKYRGIRYKGIVCEKCGVELTRSIVRRERMAHIELAAPVSHVWFLKGVPSRIGLILGLTISDLERVIYFAGYIVMKVHQDGKEKLLKELDAEYRSKVKSLQDDKTKEMIKELLVKAKREIEGVVEGVVLDEVTYHRYSMRYGQMFEAGIGAEAIYELFKKVNMDALAKSLDEQYETAGAVERPKISKRLSLVRSMIHGKVRPEWMFLVRIPVTPPALRPMVALDGGRHATSDLNDLYRRVINRNNRLKKLKEINAPDVILRNEKRILQEAVDALVDNSIRHGAGPISAMSQAQRRPLKSLSDSLKGKQGLFRQNLLGKRVDYSGRSVIVVGPNLHLNQCGLPKHMALELFRPFVIAKLLENELAYNIRGAGRLIDEGIPEVWAMLEEVIKDKYVLLNRAPTLHRLGIQAFQPILIEGNAIQIHPLVCSAFNADFDGDQMAVHVPLSAEAQIEAREIMAANKNLLKPATGDPIISIDRLDMVLGSYWVTKFIPGEKGEGKMFADPNAAITARDFGEVTFRAKIKVLATDSLKYAALEGKVFETSVGRLLFNSMLPSDYPYVNKNVTRKEMAGMVNEMIERYGIENMPPILDKIKHFGFTYSTISGITWGIDEVVIPKGKVGVVEQAQKAADELLEQYNDGLLSLEEMKRKNIEIWHAAKNDIEKLIPDSLDPMGSVYDMWQSGARGSLNQIVQMAGMKGLIASTSGETIAFPIVSSMKEGLTPVEYFISTHGSRKGLTDTALNTAKAGYLTRRLFDVAQDAIAMEEDCGTKEGFTIFRKDASGMDVAIAKHARGRYLAEDLLDPTTGDVLFPKMHLLSNDEAEQIAELEIGEVKVYSPLTCNTLYGVCQKCYGVDLGRNKIVELGEAVGTVAAQAIGEPATQLTMRTFHSGGTASIGGDITLGLPRVEEVFERRVPRNPAVVCQVDGVVSEIKETGKDKEIIILPDGKSEKKMKLDYSINYRRSILVKAGDKIKKGDLMTDGSADISELYKFGGKELAQQYIISETSRIYEMQGASIARKHIEVIVRQMFARIKLTNPGDTHFVKGDIIEAAQFARENEKLKDAGKMLMKGESLVMGISDVSLSRQSFLSSASFQHTTKVLIKAAVRGSVDVLRGLKENVIIGRLIPAGSGFEGSNKEAMIARGIAENSEREREYGA
ncbi:MAG: DNA-directed RNA polymerase subunit beta' [Parcubacteria group bacterium Gr01-1014_48]|nr:MAG: DNA-directed RNA polymerase subunit beta' [Parcubacteria group bacterium Greene0416_14]TSC74248.1 MAG: DNA-directed RNA polymerase subunit beta' [Parcubacteria group bacterium Gr01-1014_48]TSD01511.1 MAG: DNA-directed RNA polymerase subunit beta' [Parcubacteria group bacterium Greene1014_15]TSD08333.1 MAG: DNA-directed RNA polymerase subunit beta' [Parcubacteria group bacterium Greene0714_4]